MLLKISQRNDAFHFGDFSVFLNDLIRVIHRDQDGQTGVFTVFGRFRIDHRTQIVIDLFNDLEFFFVGGDNEFEHVLGWELSSFQEALLLLFIELRLLAHFTHFTIRTVQRYNYYFLIFGIQSLNVSHISCIRKLSLQGVQARENQQ